MTTSPKEHPLITIVLCAVNVFGAVFNAVQGRAFGAGFSASLATILFLFLLDSWFRSKES